MSGGDLELGVVHLQRRGRGLNAEERGRVAKRDPDRRVDGDHIGGHARDVRPRVEIVVPEHHVLHINSVEDVSDGERVPVPIGIGSGGQGP